MSAHAFGFGDRASRPSSMSLQHEIRYDGYRLMVRRTTAGVTNHQFVVVE
jgi:ATP-dependent DNA ligase